MIFRSPEGDRSGSSRIPPAGSLCVLNLLLEVWITPIGSGYPKRGVASRGLCDDEAMKNEVKKP